MNPDKNVKRMTKSMLVPLVNSIVRILISDVGPIDTSLTVPKTG